jgi:hypothetical protein
MNPLAQRLVHMFDRDGEERVNFKSFVMGLSVFNEKATAETRAAGASRGETEQSKRASSPPPSPPLPFPQPSSACLTWTATASSPPRTSGSR